MKFGEKTAILVYMPLNSVSRCSMYSRKNLLTLATLAVNAAANPGVCYWLSMDLSASDALAFMWQPVCRVKNEPPQQYCYVEYTLIGRCIAIDDHFFIKYRSVCWALNLAFEFFAIYYHTWISYHDETFSNFCLKKAPFSPKHWFDLINQHPPLMGKQGCPGQLVFALDVQSIGLLSSTLASPYLIVRSLDNWSVFLCCHASWIS